MAIKVNVFGNSPMLNGLNLASLSNWDKFYYHAKDKQYSYKINTDKGEYKILFTNTINSKPYYLEYRDGYEELGVAPTAETLAKKAAKHYSNIGKYGY